MIQGAAAAGLLVGRAVDYKDEANDANAAVANDAQEAGNEINMVKETEREIGEERAAPASHHQADEPAGDRARGVPAAAVGNGAKDARDEVEVTEVNTATAVSEQAPAANTTTAVSDQAPAANTATALSSQASAASQQGVLSTIIHLDHSRA
jgi:hypothetical protein